MRWNDRIVFQLLLPILYYVPSVVCQQEQQLHYLEQPDLLWKTRLVGMSVNALNAIEQSPIDDEILYVTTYSATLVVLSATNGSILAEVTPPPVPSPPAFSSHSSTKDFSTTSTTTTYMTCRSGMAFGTMSDGSQFLVYTITDKVVTPNYNHNGTSTSIITTTATGETQSHVVAVSIPEHEILWSSESLPGESLGSPIVFYERTTTGRPIPYVVLTHNTPVSMSDNSTEISGVFTLLNPMNGEVVWTEYESSFEEFPKGYGPLGVSSNAPIEEEDDNDNDFVVWGTYDKLRTNNTGNIFAFQLPTNFQPTQTGGGTTIPNLTSSILKMVRWTTLTRPIFDDEISAMYFGVLGDQIRGWNGKSRFDQAADWEIDLSRDSTNSFSYIPLTPALSQDGERLFMSTSGFVIHGVNSSTGKTIWDFEGTSVFVSEPRVSPDNKRVYFAQSLDGKILSLDQQNGTIMWSVGCDAFDETCSNVIVQANFALSTSGQHLYYSDVFGTVVALTVGYSVEKIQKSDDDTTTDDDEEIRIDFTLDDLTMKEEDPTRTEDGHSGRAKKTQIAFAVVAVIIACSIGMMLFVVRRGQLKIRRRLYNVKKVSNHNHNNSEDNNSDCSITPIFCDMEQEDSHPKLDPEEHFHTPFAASRRIFPIAEDYALGAVVIL